MKPYSQIHKSLTAMRSRLSAYAMKHNQTNAIYHIALSFLSQASSRSYGNGECCDALATWLSKGETDDLNKALTFTRFDISSDLHKQAFAMLESAYKFNGKI